jgi:Spy/CpxP family protein refolding chaperone
MKKRTLFCLAVFVGILVLVFSITYARAFRPKPLAMLDELGLTDEQIENIRDVQYNFRKAEIGLRADLQSSRLELRHLMIQEKSDQKEIMNVVDKIADTQKKLLKNDVDRKIEMTGILTPQQFKKFIQMKSERKKEGMERGPRFRQNLPREFPRHGKDSEL